MKKALIKVNLTVLGNNINTDVLHPSRFFSLNPEKLASGFLANEKTTAATGLTMLIAGYNFGIGSSRESTILGLKHSGVTAIAAQSFSRIFMRNAANAGIYLYLLKDIPEDIKSGMQATLDQTSDSLELGNATLQLTKPDAYLQAVINNGGLVPYLKNNGLIQ